MCIRDSSIYRPVFVLLRSDFRTSWVRFSVLRRTRTGFLEVGVWNRFIVFWVNSVGFSTALLLDLHQPGVLQFPQGVYRFLPPTVEPVSYTHLAPVPPRELFGAKALVNVLVSDVPATLSVLLLWFGLGPVSYTHLFQPTPRCTAMLYSPS